MGTEVREDQEKLKTLLVNTVNKLCKRGLTYKSLTIQGMLGVTIDEEDKFFIPFNEFHYQEGSEEEIVLSSETEGSEDEEASGRKRKAKDSRIPYKRRKSEDMASNASEEFVEIDNADADRNDDNDINGKEADGKRRVTRHGGSHGPRSSKGKEGASGKQGSGCYECRKTGHVAKDCPTKSKIHCYKCGERGHMSRDCPKEGDVRCFYCDQEGHINRECPYKEIGGGRDGSGCYNCGETGHLSRDCPKRSEMECYQCGKKGHMSRECPTAGGNRCYNCNQYGHFSRECLVKDVDGDLGRIDRRERSGSIGLGDYSYYRDRSREREYGTGADRVGRRGSAGFDSGYLGHHSRDGPSADINCYNCGERGHISRDCPLGGGSRCFECGREGHISRDCPSKDGHNQFNRGRESVTIDKGDGRLGSKCYNCGEEGHFSRDCPMDAGKKCYQCGQIGHISRDCPTSGGSRCYSCGKEGHISRDCRERVGERGRSGD